MQDSHLNDLKNKGWADMKLILDHEMPQKTNRRFAFIWMFLGAGIILSLFSVYHLLYIKKPPIVIATLKSEILDRKVGSSLPHSTSNTNSEQNISKVGSKVNFEGKVNKVDPSSHKIFASESANIEIATSEFYALGKENINEVLPVQNISSTKDLIGTNEPMESADLSVTH